jgi:predicted branched-subunit amino acid permease
MLMAVLCSSLVGAVLGIRFKVQVLFLVVPFVFIATVGIMWVAQSPFEPALLAALAAAAALQVGYLGGLLTRFSVAAARISPKRPLRSTTPAQG